MKRYLIKCIMHDAEYPSIKSEIVFSTVSPSYAIDLMTKMSDSYNAVRSDKNTKFVMEIMDDGVEEDF